MRSHLFSKLSLILSNNPEISRSGLYGVSLKLVSVFVSLVTTPIVLHSVGIPSYGLFSLLISFGAVGAISDLGIGNAIVNKLTRAKADNNLNAIVKYLTNGFYLCGLINILVSGVLYYFFTISNLFSYFSLTSPQKLIVEKCTLTLSISLGLIVFNNFVQKSLLGLGLYKLTSAWFSVSQILSSLTLITAVKNHASLSLMIFCQIGFPGLLGILAFCYLLLVHLNQRFSKLSIQIFRELLKGSRLYFFLQIFTAVSFQVDTLVVSRFLNSTQVAIYSVTWKLATIVMGLFTLALSPLWPLIGAMLEKKERERASALVFSRARSIATSSAILSVFIILFGKKIIANWSGHLISPSYFSIISISIWVFLFSTNIPFDSYLKAEHAESFLLKIFGVGSLANLLISIYLVVVLKDPGGAIAGSAISILFFNLVPGYFYVRRRR